LCAFSISLMRATSPAHNILLIWLKLTSYKAPHYVVFSSIPPLASSIFVSIEVSWQTFLFNSLTVGYLLHKKCEIRFLW
jgi:hypothetical protein